MRDRDSQLIFESYNKRVLVNELAPALAIPAAAGIGLAEVLGVIAMGVGATALAASIDSQSDRLNRAFNFTRVKKDPFESLKSTIAAQDYSARGSYELINLAKSLDVPAISGLLKTAAASVETMQSIERSLIENPDQVLQLIDSAFFTLKEEMSSIQEFFKKIKNKDLEKITEALGAQMAEKFSELNRKNEDLKKGGKKPDDNGFWQKVKQVIKYLWQLHWTMKIIMVLVGLAIAHGTRVSEGIGWLIRKTADASYEGAKGVLTGAGVISKPNTTPPIANPTSTLPSDNTLDDLRTTTDDPKKRRAPKI